MFCETAGTSTKTIGKRATLNPHQNPSACHPSLSKNAAPRGRRLKSPPLSFSFETRGSSRQGVGSGATKKNLCRKDSAADLRPRGSKHSIPIARSHASFDDPWKTTPGACGSISAKYTLSKSGRSLAPGHDCSVGVPVTWRILCS